MNLIYGDLQGWNRWSVILLLLGFFLIFVFLTSEHALPQQECNCLDEARVDLKSCVADSVVSETSILIPTYPIRGPVPWNMLNEELKTSFTLNGRVKVVHNYFFANKNVQPDEPIIYSQNFQYQWTKAEIHRMIEAIKANNPTSSYGPTTDEIFHATLKKYPVKDLNVLVIGSERPWVESFCIAYGAKRVTTVDFNVPIIEDESLIRGISIENLAKSHEKFDAIFSYSSLEHDGLGRYGDPLHPSGDIERLKRIKNLLSAKGKLFLGLPMGVDALVWNAHRVYGRTRFPLLIQGWRLMETVGRFDFDKYDPLNVDQPLNVLESE